MCTHVEFRSQHYLAVSQHLARIERMLWVLLAVARIHRCSPEPDATIALILVPQRIGDDDFAHTRLERNCLSRLVTSYMLSLVVRLVLDTNVLVAALRSGGGASREILRRCLTGRYTPLLGNALWWEYADVLGRGLTGAAVTAEEAVEVVAALAARAEWVPIFYLWRPNLPDEGDNHLVELALAGGAQAIVTHNVRDVAGGELKLRTLRVLSPAECLEIHQ